MNNKLISSLLVIALLNLVGCYSFESVTVPAYKQFVEEEGKPDEIYVKTKDIKEYHFSESNFNIENDTLYGKGKFLPIENEQPFEGNIALSEIESIRVETYDKWLTFLLVTPIAIIGTIGILALLYFGQD